MPRVAGIGYRLSFMFRGSRSFPGERLLLICAAVGSLGLLWASLIVSVVVQPHCHMPRSRNQSPLILRVAPPFESYVFSVHIYLPRRPEKSKNEGSAVSSARRFQTVLMADKTTITITCLEAIETAHQRRKKAPRNVYRGFGDFRRRLVTFSLSELEYVVVTW